jgi:LPS-assembly protein
MITRSRIFITAAWVCHLLLAAGIVTSQTLPPASQAAAPPASPAPKRKENVTIRAVEQEKDGDIYHLRGKGELYYRTYLLHADKMTYHSDTGDTELEGHVLLEGGPNQEHVEASHGTYNINTEVGTFYNAIGTIGFQVHKSRFMLTTTNPFAFTGKIVEKHGPDHYLVRNGTVTSCQLPHPKWQFNARRISVDVDSTAKIYYSKFDVEGIPVFYFPFVTHPVEKGQRQSGFLIPSIGDSNVKGYIVGETAYWAINRSMDATAGAEYYSRRGWAQHAEFRARPSDSTYLFIGYTGMLDRGIGYPPQNQGGEDARLVAEHPFGDTRGVANIDYLSSFIFRLAFTDVYAQAINSEVKSQIFLSNTTNGYHFNGLVERYQNFEVCDPSVFNCGIESQNQLVRILHTPSFFVSGEERRWGNSPFYWSFTSAAEGLQRRQVGFNTGPLVGRFDLAPSLILPTQWQGWSFRSALTLRDTFYTEQYNAAMAAATGTAEDSVINRKSLEASVEVRPPPVSRVFERPFLHHKWKHVIEPGMRYDYVTGINNFAEILRIDATDVLTNTNEVDYSIVNRLYAKQLDPKRKDCANPPIVGPDAIAMNINGENMNGASLNSALPWEQSVASEIPDPSSCVAATRELVSWEIGQKYFFDPTFGNAVLPGQRNMFTTTADLTGVAFLNNPRRFAPIISRLRVENSAHTDTEWDLDYDLKLGRINSSLVMFNYHTGPFSIGGGDTFLRVLDNSLGTVNGASDFHQYRLQFGYGPSTRRGLSGTAVVGFDANQGYVQTIMSQASYNWDCCGLSVEYIRIALGTVRDENQYRFSFNLANVGAFGNLKRQQRLY